MTTHIEAIEKAIVEFAKTHKIGKAKVETFVSAIIDTLPKQASVGSKAGEKTIKARIRIMEMKGSGKRVTAKDLASTLGVSPVEASNLLKYVGAQRVGYAERIPGKRGKIPAIFQL